MAYRRGGDSYRGSWGSDFSFEPLNVYKEKEQERAKQLVQTASEQKYGTDIPPIPGGVFGVVQRSFNSAMAQTADLKAKAPAQPQQPKSRRGPFGVVSNFLGNVGDVGEAINDALPTPVRNVREIVSDLNPVEGVARSVNDVVHGRNPITRRFNEAKRVAGDVLSGEQFLGELGVDSSKLPDKPTMPLRQLADVAASPLTLVTAGTAGVARAGAQAGAKAITGAVLRQLGKEAVSGTVGYVAGQQASEHLPEGTPGIVKAGVGLGAGILAGGAAYKAIENPSRALQLSMNAAKAPGPLKGLSIEDVTKNPARVGRTTEVQSTVHPNTKYGFRYRIVDLSDPLVSHDPYTFQENPAYNQILQPRDRSAAASQGQVETMARNLDPNRMLAEAGNLQDGVPIIGPDGIMESGNGRTMAAIRASKDHPERWQAYQDELRNRLDQFGLTDQSLEGVQQPFLVRERLSNVDRGSFVKEANTSSTLRMGTLETAKADSQMISDELLHGMDIPDGATLDDVLQSPRSKTFVRHFMDQLPDTERGALIDTKGQLSAQGVERLKAAFFAKTYPGVRGEQLLQNFFESASPEVRNVRAGMEQTLPAIAQLEAGIRAGRISPSLSIAEDVAAAADAFRKIKSGTLKFKTVDDYLSQSSMFGDEMDLSPVGRDILAFMDKNNRSAKQIREALKGYVEEAAKAPPPNQGGMFGGDLAGPAMDAVSVWERATGRVVPAEGGTPGVLDMGSGRVEFPGNDPNASDASGSLPESTKPTTTNDPNARSESPLPPAESNIPQNPESGTPNIASDANVASSELPSETSVGSNTGTSVAPEKKPSFQMPPGTERSNPKYSYRDKQFNVMFQDDLDRALYILAQPERSKADAKILASVMEYLPGKSEEEIRGLGKAVRDRIKIKAKDAPRGSIINLEPGVHELGVAEGLPEPKPFPHQRNNADGTVSQEGPPRSDPRRAVHQPLPGAVGEAGPRGHQKAPTNGRIEPGQVMAPGARGAEADPNIGSASGPNTPASAPPAPPPKEPPVTEPGPGNPQRGFGQTGEPVDLLNGRDRAAVIADAEAGQSTRLGKAKSRVVKRAPEVQGVANELDRTNHIVREFPAEQVDSLRFDAEKAGLRVQPRENGWVVVGKDGREISVSDLVEGRGDAATLAADLTPEQQAILDRVQQVTDYVNRTAEAHGVDIAKVDTETGSFWPRKVIAREVEGRRIEKNQPTGTNRSIGRNRLGKRTEVSEAIGQGNGVVYDNPWTALEDSWRNKLRMAQDSYVAKMVEPLASKEAKSGFGYKPVPGNHPAFTTKGVVGTGEGGAAIMTDQPMMFPNDVADQLGDVFNSRSIADTKPGKFVQAINAVTTPIRASTDASYLLNQGLGLLESSPRNLAKGVKASARVVLSAMGDPQKYADLRRAESGRTAELLARAGVDEAQQSGYLVRMGKHYAAEGAVYEQQFPTWFQNSVGKVPKVGTGLERTVKWSNETFGRYLNYARDVLANDALEQAVAKGLKGQALDDEMRSAMKSVNRMTGWTNSKPTGLESIGMFAPRFFRSNVEQIVAAATKGGMEGNIARAHLLKLVGIGAGLTIAVNEARGYNTDLDPRSNNFLRIRNLGGQDISPFGPFATLVRGIAQTAGGQPGEMTGEAKGHGFTFGTNLPSPDVMGAVQFARAKASPTLSTAWDLVTGRTFDDRPITPNPLSKEFYTNTIPDVGREQVPFSFQALVNEGPVAAATSALGAQGSEVTPAEKRDIARGDVAREKFGKAYADLSGDQKAQVNLDERVAKNQREVERRRLESGTDEAKRATADKTFRDRMKVSAQFLTSGQDKAGKPFSGNDYRDAYHDAVLQRLGAFSVLDKPTGDSDVNGYFDLYRQADMGNGKTDYAKLDQLEAAYVADHPGVMDKVDKAVGVQDDPTLRKFRKAQKEAQQYYALPAYRGMTKEQADKANEVLTQANGMVSSKVAVSRAGALAQLIKAGKITAEDAALANRAARVGTNPERQKFKMEHELFRTFYSDAANVEGAAVVASAGGSSSTKRAKLNLGGSSGGGSKPRSRYRTAGGARR